MSHLRRASALVLSVLLMSLTLSAAHADQRSFRDRAGDNVGRGGYGDLGRVVVDHGRRAVRITVSAARGGNLGDGLDIFVDTRGGRSGPEYRMGWEMYLSEAVFIGSVRGWGYDDYENQRCRGKRVRGGLEKATFVVPRSCLTEGRRKPARVRVNVQAINFEGTEPRDHAPRRHRFGPWVGR
jgi:hypothetical protein